MGKKKAMQAMERESAERSPGAIPVAGPDRDWQRDWKWLLLLGAVVYLTCLGIRLLEVPAWEHPGLSVDGQPILATHDSYFWLAVAKGVRGAYNSFLGTFTGLLHSVTGISLPRLAFWFPAILSSLVAVATMVWGWFLGGRWAGLLAGLIGGLAPGLFSRTRLGYYDTDMFTLLMPMLVALLLIGLLLPHIRTTWLPVRGAGPDSRESGAESPAWRALLMAAGFGLLTRLAGIWHADLTHMHLLFWYMALALGLLLGRPGQRSRVVLLLAVFAIAAFPYSGEIFVWISVWEVWSAVLGWLPYSPYWLLALLALIPAGALLVQERNQGVGRSFGALWFNLGLLVILLLVGGLATSFANPVAKLWLYLNPASGDGGQVAASAQAAGPVYPSVVQSIIEAKLVGWGKVMQRMGPFSWGSALGILGFGWVCWKRPLAVFLLPLLVLSLAGHWTGIRFTMFGGPMVALGLGVPLAWLTRRLPVKGGQAWLEPAVQLAVGVAMLIPLGIRYSKLPPTPVLDLPHAEALIELGEIAPDKAMVWTWWDWGYATQYYTGHTTINDGGRHDGRDVYPVAVALSTSSLDQANNMIRYSASRDYRPADVWDTMSGGEVAAFVNGLKHGALDTPGIAPQYLVVGWQDFKILEWISRFGNWDPVAGKGVAGVADRIRGFRFDPTRGAVVFEKGGGAVPVSTVDSLEPDHVNHKDYWLNSGPHLVFNQHRGDAYLMDDAAYDSVLVQLMLKKPHEVSRYFELVYDGMPHVRVFRVKGS